VYGSTDAGNEIASSEKFEHIAQKVAKAMHLKPHVVIDEKGDKHTLATSMDMKGVVGSDSRNYLLDLYRATPVDCEFLDMVDKEVETNPYPHRMTLVRTELVDLFYQSKVRRAVLEYQEQVLHIISRNPRQKLMAARSSLTLAAKLLLIRTYLQMHDSGTRRRKSRMQKRKCVSCRSSFQEWFRSSCWIPCVTACLFPQTRGH
jgi:hypothetical protein